MSDTNNLLAHRERQIESLTDDRDNLRDERNAARQRIKELEAENAALIAQLRDIQRQQDEYRRRAEKAERAYAELQSDIVQAGGIEAKARQIVAEKTRLEAELAARRAYAERNPLGGPAAILYAAADRIEAGEDFYEVMRDMGFHVDIESEVE